MKLDRGKIILIFIILLAAFLRLANLSRADMIGDAAHYSFRAIGYLDYLAPNNQTTPLVWFGFRPWWSYLSFHEHPPLVFLIQHLFFKIFGISTFVARLPAALFGLGSVLLIYWLAQALFGKKTGYLAALLLAISNYHVWISREAYLESVLMFFILLALAYFIKALKNDSYFIHFGIFLGLSFLCKYTAFFLLPVVFVYLFIWQRKSLVSRKFWLGLVLTLLIFSPVLIYNLKMQQTRGHFDVQFAALFGQEVADWPVLQRSVSSNVWPELLGLWQGLKTSFSFVVFWLFLLALFYLVSDVFLSRKKPREHSLLILLLFFLTLFFVLTQTAVYFISVYSIFVVLALSCLLARLFELVKGRAKYVLAGILFLPFLYLLLFTINTNLSERPKGSQGKWYAPIRQENNGLKQLEDFLNDKTELKQTKLKKIRVLEDITLVNSQGVLETNKEVPDIFIYDGNLNWFAQMWHFRPRFIYQKIFFMSAQEFLAVREYKLFEDIRDYYRDFYFIRLTHSALLDSIEYREPFANNLEEILTKEFNLSPSLIIKNPKGEEAFRIYKFQ